MVLAAQISELRLGDVEPTVEYVRGIGAEIDPAGVITALSLIAREGETIVGAVVCSVDAEGRRSVNLVMPTDGADPVLAATMLNKAIMKVQARSYKTFCVNIHGGIDAASMLRPECWTPPEEDSPEVTTATDSGQAPAEPEPNDAAEAA